jgi:ADP-ribose pyrophosphatase YjhB (NUDIX family)
MTWKPHLTVAALIENDGRFLMVQENISGKSVYNQPAGHLEDKETLLDAVIRETREETAWHFEPKFISGIYHWRHPDKDKTFIRVSFAGQGLYHDPACQLDSCIERTLWLTPEELGRQADRLRSPMVLRSIEDYLAGTRYPLSLLTSFE